jgi:predicted Zn-dependent protease
MNSISARAGMAAVITTLMISLGACSGGIGSGTPRDAALGEWRPLQRTAALTDRGEVGLVPVGKTPASTVSALADYYRGRLGVNVRVLHNLTLPPEATDLKRGQIVAETVITLLQSRFPQTKYLIGVVDADMYSREAGYRFAFSNRDWGDDWGVAIVSTARMDPTHFRQPADPELLMARLKKMVTKNLSLVYYQLETSTDPKSVLFSPVMSVDDLDRMGQGF